VASEDTSGNGVGRSDNGTEWVSLKEAAAEAGVSVSTLRAWSRKGEVDSQLRSGSRGKERIVRKAEVLAKVADNAPRFGRGAAATSSNGNGVAAGGRRTPSVPELIKELGDARERAARAEATVDLLREQLAEVNVRLDALLLDGGTGQPAIVEDLDDGLPEGFPRLEDDEYLPLIPRWIARHKRRKMLKKTMREIQLPN
jgi:hypothetical protein